jgi:hypothetical protein
VQHIAESTEGSKCVPDLAVLLNAGLAAYESWSPTMTVLKVIPVVVTDYCEEAALWAQKACPWLTHLVPNPFYSPMRLPNSFSGLRIPCFSNAFMYVYWSSSTASLPNVHAPVLSHAVERSSCQRSSLFTVKMQISSSSAYSCVSMAYYFVCNTGDYHATVQSREQRWCTIPYNHSSCLQAVPGSFKLDNRAIAETSS